MLLWVNYTNEMSRLFLHLKYNQKLGRFLAIFAVQPIHLYVENLCSLKLLCKPFICLKYTAILFPLVSNANETCGLFSITLFKSLSQYLDFTIFTRISSKNSIFPTIHIDLCMLCKGQAFCFLLNNYLIATCSHSSYYAHAYESYNYILNNYH